MAFPFFSFGGKKKKEKTGKPQKLPPLPKLKAPSLPPPPAPLKPMAPKRGLFPRLLAPKPKIIYKPKIKIKKIIKLKKIKIKKVVKIKEKPKKIFVPKIKIKEVPRNIYISKIKIKKIIKFKKIKPKTISKKDARNLGFRLARIEKELYGLGGNIKSQLDKKLAGITDNVSVHKSDVADKILDFNRSNESDRKDIRSGLDKAQKDLTVFMEKSGKELDTAQKKLESNMQKLKEEIRASAKTGEKSIAEMKETVGDIEKAFSGPGFKEWVGVLDDALDEARKLEEKDSRIISVVNKLDRRLQNVENHAATCMSAEQRCQMINDNLARESSQLKQTASNLMAQASALNGKFVQLINAINSSNAQIGQLGARVSNVEAQLAMLAELKNELSRAEAESAQLSSKLNELERETTKTIVID